METAELLKILEDKKQNEIAKKAVAIERWKGFADALRPLANRLCVENLTFNEQCMTYLDCNYMIPYEVGIDEDNDIYVKTTDYDNYAYYDQYNTDDKFKEWLVQFLESYLKSEEEAKAWHETRHQMRLQHTENQLKVQNEEVIKKKWWMFWK